MPDLQLLDVPAGPPLAALAAALPPERRPVLLAGDTGTADLHAWRYLGWDPVAWVEHRVTGAREPDRTRRGLPRALGTMRRHLGAPDAGDPAPAGAAPRPPFTGGLVGLLGFDLGRELERLPATNPADVDLPDLACGVYASVLAEHVPTGRRVLAARLPAGAARARVTEVAALAERAAPVAPPAADQVGAPRSTFEAAAYEDAVRRVVAHIREGDIYQVNLSQRFELPYRGDAAALHAAVSAGNPVPFGWLLRTPDWSALSNSPELFLRRRGALVESRPIKGTRPRGGDAEEDARLRAELEASEKELAELAMIVDLVRNDLGRSAVLGSVTVDLPFETDAWSTVFHRLARVRARLPDGADVASFVEAAFPPASVTGTPKIRALEIVEDMEPVRRHAYTGAFGWIDAGGDLDLSVNIRIATLRDGRLLVPVGGGITVGSDPAAEYAETLHKARAMFDALSVPLPSGSLVA